MAKNKSKYNATGLAGVLLKPLLENPTSAEFMFDASVNIEAIVDIPRCTLGSGPNSILEDFIDDLDSWVKQLDRLQQFDTVEYDEAFEHLRYIPGFLVKASCDINDFSDTTFGTDGVADSFRSEPGRYIVYGYGKTLDLAYAAIAKEVAERVSKDIKRALK